MRANQPTGREDRRASGNTRGRLFSAIWNFARWLVVAVGIAIVAAVVLILQKSVAPSVQVDPKAGKNLEVQLRQAKAEAFRGPQEALEVNEAELNGIIGAYVRPANREREHDPSAALRDIKFQLVEDRLRVYVLLDAYGKDLTINLEGKLYTENGYIQFEPVSGRLGALPLPRAWLASAVRELMNSPEDREDLRLPPYLRDLRIENGKLLLTYQ